MRGTTFAIAAASASVLALGCVLRTPKTEVSADDFDLAPLAGKWTGEYTSQESGRTGDVSFVLRAGEVAASGRIEMIARESENASIAAYRPMVDGGLGVPVKQLLTIHFVRKEGNTVIGLLDPYIDPDCVCKVTTTFQGAFVDSRTIEGTFNTFSAELSHIPNGGRWKVTRTKHL
jgi:hypothetical protein